MIRYVIRPASIRTTPLALKTAFGAQRLVRYPGPSRRLLSWERDFFLAYPEPHRIEEFHDADNPALVEYCQVRTFYTSNKPTQRSILDGLGFRTPRTFRGLGESLPGTGIARPLRHTSGRGFRIVADPQVTGTWDPTTEYLQEIYPKTHEYRVLIVRGEPLVTLIKRVPEDTPHDMPWNHAQGAYFVTVNNFDNNRLRHTPVYDLIHENQGFFQYVDLAGLDVMFNQHDQSYSVCELNFCPSLSIPSNLQKVTQHVLSLSRQP